MDAGGSWPPGPAWAGGWWAKTLAAWTAARREKPVSEDLAGSWCQATASRMGNGNPHAARRQAPKRAWLTPKISISALCAESFRSAAKARALANFSGKFPARISFPMSCNTPAVKAASAVRELLVSLSAMARAKPPTWMLWAKREWMEAADPWASLYWEKTPPRRMRDLIRSLPKTITASSISVISREVAKRSEERRVG